MRIKALFLALFLTLFSFSESVAIAATQPADEEIEKLIEEQSEIRELLNKKKNDAESERLKNLISKLERQIKDLQKDKEKTPQKNIDAIAQQIEDLKEQVKENQTNQERILQLIERLERLEIDNQLNKEVFEYGTPVPSSNSTLVKPTGNSSVSYTQDAVNSQGNSTMIFQYAPNQLYKIYCRVGYLTDLSLKKGEQISFVGGGDTSAWAVNSTTVDGVPHVYIKPTVPTSTTNLIITTNKRSYQLILNTSDWYNPMVTWTYGQENLAESMQQKEKDERTITATFSNSLENLNFNYESKGKIPDVDIVAVFDDGEKTIIKFNNLPSKMPIIFIKQVGKKDLNMVNYKIRDKCYILDRVADEIVLKGSSKETIKIKRK